jgi:hypothetical protein
MADSLPTRGAPYRLRIERAGQEDWRPSASLAQAVAAMREELIQSLGTKRVHLFEPSNLPACSIIEHGTWVLGYRDTRYQAEHHQYGATWRVRREWLRLAIYGKGGHVVPVTAYWQLLQPTAPTWTQRGGYRNRVALGVRGKGPVFGIRKSRGGPIWFRRPHTAGELRQNAATYVEEGEPRVRLARNGNRLPTDRNDFWRQQQRSWKVQGKHARQWSRRRKL